MEHDPNRRMLIAALAGLTLANVSLAPTPRREKPLVIECDQERRTTETVTSWLETIRS